jgi:hypothetical protein
MTPRIAVLQNANSSFFAYIGYINFKLHFFLSKIAPFYQHQWLDARLIADLQDILKYQIDAICWELVLLKFLFEYETLLRIWIELYFPNVAGTGLSSPVAPLIGNVYYSARCIHSVF